MNKAELIDAVASRIDVSKKDAAVAVQAVVDAITEAVVTGQKVSISGFGVFERAARSERTYRAPSTGERILKMATSVPRFRPGGDFRALVAGQRDMAERAVSAALGGAEDVMNAAGNVVDSARSAVGLAAPRTKEKVAAVEAPPARKTAARKAPAKKASTAAASATEPAKRAPAKRAPAKKATPAAAEAPEQVAEPAKKAAAKRAPAKRAPAKKAAASAAEAPPAPAPEVDAAPADAQE